ncbi:unnamed protein product, partial [Effrenium voratum]
APRPAPCESCALPQISRSLSQFCRAGPSASAAPAARGEWVGGAQRWRFRRQDAPCRSERSESPTTCSRAMHPVTAQRWDLKARSASDSELKRLGYHPGLPRARGGPNAQSRFKDLVPEDLRANSDCFDPPPQMRALAADREHRRKVKLQTLDRIRVLRYEDPSAGRLVVQRWRPGYVDLKVSLPKEPASPNGSWQGGLRNTVCDNLVTFSGVF